MAKETEKLSAAQRSKIRRLSEPKELAADEEGGELNIVPFLDIITNVMMFVLATVSVTFTATIDTSPPRAGGSSASRPPDKPSLGLTVILVQDGFSIKGKGSNVAPGCKDLGPGLAIPKKGPDYDYAALGACVKHLKNDSDPVFKEETAVTISANPNIPYQAIIGAMDAVRKDEGEGECAFDPKLNGWVGATCLFPEVNFGLAR
jgi:biopolymer transport protein TolR